MKKLVCPLCTHVFKLKKRLTALRRRLDKRTCQSAARADLSDSFLQTLIRFSGAGPQLHDMVVYLCCCPQGPRISIICYNRHSKACAFKSLSNRVQRVGWRHYLLQCFVSFFFSGSEIVVLAAPRFLPVQECFCCCIENEKAWQREEDRRKMLLVRFLNLCRCRVCFLS